MVEKQDGCTRVCGAKEGLPAEGVVAGGVRSWKPPKSWLFWHLSPPNPLTCRA